MSMPPAAAYSRKNPFPAKLKTIRELTGPGSDKETAHIELSLEGSGLCYEPGDSLGVFPRNDPALVGETLSALGLPAEQDVPSPAGPPVPVSGFLSRQADLREPSRQLLAAIHERCPEASELGELLHPEAKPEMDEWVGGREVIDILLAYPGAKFSPEELPLVLRKLQPRLYSIASSQKAHPDEVHLTVAVVRYDLGGRRRQGVCSTFLADRARDADIPVFIHSAKHFRLPEDPAAPLIMVGPGTGIAPFRAFLEDKERTGVQNPAWLLFGERHRDTGFFYREDLERWLESGVLQRLDTAFSRDQDQKIYVQHRLMENAAELWKWLDRGAYFYVCGDASRMAADVDGALRRIAAEQGGVADPAAFVEDLRKSKRYRRDVY